MRGGLSYPGDPGAPPRGRNHALDGLRAIAVALVVGYHLEIPWLSGGFVGVDVFFVLSGYLITALLLSESDRSGRVDLRGFLARRLRRLWPLAWLVLAVVVLGGLVGAWGVDRQARLPNETVAALANVSNWWAIGHGGYVESFAAPSPLRHFWSLAVEEQFYLVWPAVLVASLGLARRWRSLRAAPTVAVAVLAAASIATGFATSTSWAYLATPTRAVELLAGAALAMCWRRWPLTGPDRSEHRRWWGLAAMTGGAVLLAVALMAHPEDRWLATGGFAWIGLAGAALVAGALCGPSWLRRSLGSGPMAWIGIRSYAIYLLHWPILVAFGPAANPMARALVVVVGSIAGAELLHRLVERPVQLHRPRLRTLARAGGVLAMVMVVALVAARPTEPTPTQLAAQTFGAVPDPTIPSSPVSASPIPSSPAVTAAAAATTCPSVTPNSTSTSPSAGFDASTVGVVADPAADCESVRLLVVGDSTGRGASNGLVGAADPRLSTWDRTALGCSFNPECEHPWRETFQSGVDTVDPDVALVYAGVVDDLAGIDDADFLSRAGRDQRVATLVGAARILSSRGAAVVFITPTVPRRPNGLFFCDGRAQSSRCDPAWVREWNDSVREAAVLAGAQVVDVGSWIDARPDPASTRPDGLHLSSAALVDLGRWLSPQLIALAARSTP